MNGNLKLVRNPQNLIGNPFKSKQNASIYVYI